MLETGSREFVVTVNYRLGSAVFTMDGQYPACGLHSDKEGDQDDAISCGSDGEQIARHNHLRDTMYHTTVSTALALIIEDRALLPGTDARPADVLIPRWTHGKDTALDVTVVNPCQASLVAQAGHALTYAYNKKMAGAGAACQQEGIVFIPLPAESLGGWHVQAVLQVRKLRSALSR